MDSDEDMFACCNEPSQSQPISLSPASSHELYEPSPKLVIMCELIYCHYPISLMRRKTGRERDSFRTDQASSSCSGTVFYHLLWIRKVLFFLIRMDPHAFLWRLWYLRSCIFLPDQQCWYGSGSANPYPWIMDPDSDPVQFLNIKNSSAFRKYDRMTGRQEYDRTKDRQSILGKYMIDM